jgi:hypothetical protein
MPAIFVVGFVGKAIGVVFVVFVLAMIGLFALLKKVL